MAQMNMMEERSFGLIPGVPGQQASYGSQISNSLTSRKKNSKALGDLMNQLMREQEADYKRAEQQQRAMLAQIAKSYAEAGAQMGRGAEISRRDAADMARYNQAQMQQSMMNRGLGNTTAYDAGQRAVNADTARRFAEINQGFGGQMANLAQNRAAAMAGAQNAATNFYQQRAAARSGLGMDAARMLKAPPKRRSGIGGMLGGLAGAFLGGPGGAFVGNALFGGGGGGGNTGGMSGLANYGYGGMNPGVYGNSSSGG